jgi:hypothetical protein
LQNAPPRGRVGGWVDGCAKVGHASIRRQIYDGFLQIPEKLREGMGGFKDRNNRRRFSLPATARYLDLKKSGTQDSRRSSLASVCSTTCNYPFHFDDFSIYIFFKSCFLWDMSSFFTVTQLFKVSHYKNKLEKFP